MNNLFCGIDPGWTGSFAWMTDDPKSAMVVKCPQHFTGMNDILKYLISFYNPNNIFCIMEDVHARGGIWSAQTNFRLGENIGIWKSVLNIHNVRYNLYSPQKWQKLILGKFPKGESKKTSIVIAKTIFPDLCITIGSNHNHADALNLCKCCSTLEWNE